MSGWPKLFRDVKGMRGHTRVELHNGVAVLPVGTPVTIVGGHNWSSLEIRTDPCTCCGVSLKMSRVEKFCVVPDDVKS
jgi:hypothetical protein